MTVFRAYLKVLNKCKVPIIMYTAFLVFFGGFNLQNDNSSISFTASKPDIAVVNRDENGGLTGNLIKYLSNHANVKDSNEFANLDDALFYRDVNYILYVPENFSSDYLSGLNPKIEVKSTGDYQASLAEMLIQKYLKVADSYRTVFEEEDVLLENIDEILSKEVEIEMTSSLDTGALEKASFYYNFLNYCLLAGLIYVICLVMSSFKSVGVAKRTIVSSTNYKLLNRQLLLSNSLFAFVLWLIYVILSIILVGDIMFTSHGLLLILNSFVFSFCCLSIALLLGNLVTNKEAVNGIVNVIALGSSFLCGAFVPMSFLPKGVLTIAHALPSYWFISSNEMIKELETIDLPSLKPFITNIAVLACFSLAFIIITNVVSRHKRKLD